jgi:hypothetical protein
MKIKNEEIFEGITEEVIKQLLLWTKNRFMYRKGSWIKIKIKVINED